MKELEVFGVEYESLDQKLLVFSLKFL